VTHPKPQPVTYPGPDHGIQTTRSTEPASSEWLTVLLDDPVLVTLLRRYLKVRGYRHGPLFRAEKNYVGGPLRYASVQEL
jgi:hypothetical protein